MQLKVIKADGSVEEYLHTKIIGAVNNALAGIEEADIQLAEPLAEVVTYFLYHQSKSQQVSSSEIFSIVKAVLAAAGYEDAAISFAEHHFKRRLRRRRIEVVEVDIKKLADAQCLCHGEHQVGRHRWDKSRIVEHLVTKHDINPQTARTIAAMVEEKIFSMGLTQVPASLVKQVVLGDAATVLHAEKQLQTV